MKRIILFIFVIATSISTYGTIFSDKEISMLVKDLNAQRPSNISFSKVQRTIVCDIYNADASVVEEMTPSKLAKSFNDVVATRNACNFISVRAIYHYQNDRGAQLTKTVEASPFDFLGITNDEYRISLKDNPRALDVNIEISEPRGWRKSSSNNSHTVAHYMYGEGEDQVSYMIQVFALPLFLSRNETRDMFSGSEEYGLTKEDLLEDVKGEIFDIKEDAVGLYPALHVKLSQDVVMLGDTRPLYTNLWYIIYEDRAIMIWGTAMRPTEFEMNLYDLMFQLMVSQVRFPDHFEKKYE